MEDWKIIAEKSFRGVTGYGDDADEKVKSGVIEGIKFLEENPELNPEATQKKSPVRMYPPKFETNADYEKLESAISPKLYGASGAMFYRAVSIVMYWKIHGTKEFLEQLREVTKGD